MSTPSNPNVASRFVVPRLPVRYWIEMVVVAAAVAAPLLSSSSYLLFLGTTAAISALQLLSVGVVVGDTGMVSLCQVAFAGMGAWLMTWFAAHDHPLPILVEIVITCAAVAALGAVVALPALRLRSVNLAVVTLGVASAVGVFLSAQGFPFPASGEVIPRPGFLASERALYILCVLVFVLVVLALNAIRKHPVGVAWRSVRQSERATAALGVSVTVAKVTAFSVSAMIAALSGILLVMQLGAVTPNNFTVVQSLILVAIGLFIGSWRWQGAVVAGLMNVALPELLQQIGLSVDWSNLFFAVGAIQALASGRSLSDKMWPKREPGRGKSAPPAWNPNSGLQRGPVAAVTARPEGDEGTLNATDTVAPVATSSPTAALELRGLSVRYSGVHALNDVSLTVAPGSITGLLGANGAGKSTLVDAVSGFTTADGSVLVAGAVLDGGPRHRAQHGIRRTFQQDRLPDGVSVGEYLRLAAGRPLDEEEAENLLAFSGAPSTGTPIEKLDTSTRRLLEVAAAFAAKPDVVLLDEPVAGLSGAEALMFAQRLRHAPAVFGPAVLIIEHDMDFVRAVCDVAYVLDFGKLIAAGAPDETLNTAVVRAAYLGEAVQAA